MRKHNHRKINRISDERNAKLYSIGGFKAWWPGPRWPAWVSPCTRRRRPTFWGNSFQIRSETIQYVLMCCGGCYVVSLRFVAQQCCQTIVPAMAKQVEIAREL
ncbi:unnamed protein product [Prorocentrum cordatum]|uniref:Prohibitin n=1 Tax=Prorocentrum cordatum TaxID=2364126 RepID=A0ABN9U1E5_9DINO|nr:unnamed protein product [Polarella glacialis]